MATLILANDMLSGVTDRYLLVLCHSDFTAHVSIFSLSSLFPQVLCGTDLESVELQLPGKAVSILPGLLFAPFLLTN